MERRERERRVRGQQDDAPEYRELVGVWLSWMRLSIALACSNLE